MRGGIHRCRPFYFIGAPPVPLANYPPPSSHPVPLSTRTISTTSTASTSRLIPVSASSGRPACTLTQAQQSLQPHGEREQQRDELGQHQAVPCGDRRVPGVQQEVAREVDQEGDKNVAGGRAPLPAAAAMRWPRSGPRRRSGHTWRTRTGTARRCRVTSSAPWRKRSAILARQVLAQILRHAGDLVGRHIGPASQRSSARVPAFACSHV